MALAKVSCAGGGKQFGTLSVDKTAVTFDSTNSLQTVTVTTNYNAITATVADESICTATVEGNSVQITGKNVGSTTITIAVVEQAGLVTPAPVSVTCEVAIVRLAVPNVSNTSFDWDGNPHAPTVDTYDESLIAVTNPEKTDADNYTVTFSLKDKNGYQWSDGTTADKKISWRILGTVLDYPQQSDYLTLTYTGSALTPAWVFYDSAKLTIGGTTSATDAGEYTATFTPKGQYVWYGNSKQTINVDWRIRRKVITTGVPTQSNTLTYNGKEQSPTWNNYNSSMLAISGELSATDAHGWNGWFHPYIAYFDPKDNYCWAHDGEWDDFMGRENTWLIHPKRLTSAQSTFKQSGTLTFNSDYQKVTISGFDSSLHDLWGDEAIDAGTYTSEVTLKDPNNYMWYDTEYNTSTGQGNMDNSNYYKKVTWTIQVKKLTKPSISPTSFTYDGNGHEVTARNFDEDYIGVRSNVYFGNPFARTNRGTYEAWFYLYSTTNTTWSDGTTDDIKVTWTII